MVKRIVVEAVAQELFDNGKSFKRVEKRREAKVAIEDNDKLAGFVQSSLSCVAVKQCFAKCAK